MGEGSDPDDATSAEHDAAAVVRAAFAQAERLNRQADEAKAEAERLLAETKAEADRILASVNAEREHLLAEARRDRVAAEEAMLRARADAEREAADVLARASELARREAEVLLEGSRMELLRARDEATTIRAQAERDAEAIISAATARARTTSAEILGATRRRLGEALAGPAPPRSKGDEAVDLTDDRPPPAGYLRYRMDWTRDPTDVDIDMWVEDAVSRALAKTFGGRRHRHRRSPSGVVPPLRRQG